MHRAIRVSRHSKDYAACGGTAGCVRRWEPVGRWVQKMGMVGGHSEWYSGGAGVQYVGAEVGTVCGRRGRAVEGQRMGNSGWVGARSGEMR